MRCFQRWISRHETFPCEFRPSFQIYQEVCRYFCHFLLSPLYQCRLICLYYKHHLWPFYLRKWFFKEVKPTVEEGALWCLRPPPESPVPHQVFVLVKAFGSCSLFAVLFISVGPSLSFYPLIYKSILKYICQRLSRTPDMFCHILLSTVMECNKDSAHGLRGRNIQNRSCCLFNEQCAYGPPYKNVSSPKDTRKK